MGTELRRRMGAAGTALAIRWIRARGAARPTPGPSPGDPRHIVVVELSRLGDVVQATGAVAALRRRFPGARIEVAVDRSWRELLVGQPGIDGVLEVAPGLEGLRTFVQRSCGSAVDLLVNTSPSTRNSIAVHGGTAKCRVGYLDLRSSLTPFRDRNRIVAWGENMAVRVDEVPPGTPLPRRSDAVLEQVDCGAAEPARLRADAETARRLRDELRAAGLEGRGPVVLHPGAAWRHRSWSPQRWGRVARELAAEHALVVTGSASERPVVEAVCGQAPGAVPFVERRLGELLALMDQATVFVGADSGPLHLACAVGTPAVGLFGPAAPSLTAPTVEDPEWFFEELPCSPCDQRRCVRREDACVDRVDPGPLLDAVRRRSAMG